MSTPAIVVRPIEQVQLNDANPRLIKDNRFEQLVQSLIDFPDMLQVRPIVIDEHGVALGGNMRLHAALRLGYTEVPTLQVTGWSEHQKREFIIKDNASFGEWNWETLANEWSEEPLGAWGLDLPKDWLEPDEGPTQENDLGTSENVSFDATSTGKQYTLTITFTSPEQLQAAETDITELLDRSYPGATYTLVAGQRQAKG